MQRTEERFPERALLWQHIKDQNQLAKIVDTSSDKYIQLYTSNYASARDKNSALIAMEMAGCSSFMDLCMMKTLPRRQG